MNGGGLEAVFFANRAVLLRFLRARGAGPDAEDVLQELWLKIANVRLDGPVAEPLAYLHRMADNLMHDRFRSADARRGREKRWSDAHDEWSSEISAAPSAERAMLARERVAVVEGALGALSDRAQAIFRRFRIDGASHRAIAAEQGISVSAVEKHIRRAYRAILAEMDRYAADEPLGIRTGLRDD